MQKLGLILTLLIVIAEGCSVSRKSMTPRENIPAVNSSDIVEFTIGNNISERNFDISKATIEITQNRETQKLLIGIRHKKPDTTLLIIRSRMGVEAARILLTNDTILINDRINKNLIIGKPKEVKNKYGLDARMLYMLLGDLLKDKNDMESGNENCSKGSVRKVFSVDGRDVEYNIDCTRGKVTNTEIREDVLNNGMSIRFQKFLNVDGVIIPQKIEFSDEDLASDIKISIERILINWTGRIEFNTGSGYQISKLK